jgi:hypothetical protein
MSEAQRRKVQHVAARLSVVAIAALFAACDGVQTGGIDPRPEPERIAYGEPRELARLANERVNESSGLAASRLRDDVFWTHNDSGDAPRIYAFDSKGADLGTWRVKGAKASDWEDMASFTLDGKAYLLLADCGDNALRRSHGTLYLVEEPADKESPAKLVQTVEFTFEGGPRDCEAVAFDRARRLVLLAGKRIDPDCEVFQLPWPAIPTAQDANAESVESADSESGDDLPPDEQPDEQPDDRIVAEKIGTLELSLATGMDISPDGTRAIIITYGDAYEFTHRKGEDWREAFSRGSRNLPMPERRQGEAICYGPDGKILYLTSEHAPAPFWEVPVVVPARR